jgi:hypothetical protein
MENKNIEETEEKTTDEEIELKKLKKRKKAFCYDREKIRIF